MEQYQILVSLLLFLVLWLYTFALGVLLEHASGLSKWFLSVIRIGWVSAIVIVFTNLILALTAPYLN